MAEELLADVSVNASGDTWITLLRTPRTWAPGLSGLLSGIRGRIRKVGRGLQQRMRNLRTCFMRRPGVIVTVNR